MYSIDLNSKVAWVTGGSRGIGRAICIALAQANCKVALTYIKNKDAADEVVKCIKANGGEAIAIQGDVSSQEQIIKMHDQVVGGLGDVEILVNNCLLYTSPSPRDATLSRMPSSA